MSLHLYLRPVNSARLPPFPLVNIFMKHAQSVPSLVQPLLKVLAFTPTVPSTPRAPRWRTLQTISRPGLSAAEVRLGATRPLSLFSLLSLPNRHPSFSHHRQTSTVLPLPGLTMHEQSLAPLSTSRMRGSLMPWTAILQRRKPLPSPSTSMASW